MNGKQIKCFSYQRYSSAAQADGTSIARQAAVARRVAKENGLEYVEIFDRGVSAFKGRNSVDGKLGEFISDVRSNKIPNNCWLIVENLDRLTRQNPYKAFGLMSELIELGVTIVTGNDNKKYSRQSVNDDLGDLFTMILEFTRGHNESKVKSLRTYGHAAEMVKLIKLGVKSKSGCTLAIESIGNNVWWSETFKDDENDKRIFIREHRIYFAIVEEIIGLILNGSGTRRILKYLNENYAPPQINKNSSRRYWSHNLIAKLHRSKALYGEKTITIDGVEEVIENYYPKLIDKETYYRIRDIKAARKSNSTVADTHVRLLSGMKILACGHCGGGMHGLFVKGKYLRYKCTNGAGNKGCLPWSFNALYVEDTLLRLAANNVYRQENENYDFEHDETILRNEVADIRNRTNKIVDAIETTDVVVEPLLKRMASLTEAEKICVGKIERLQIEKAKQEVGAIEWGDITDSVLDIENESVRLLMKEKIRQSVRKVICTQIGHGNIQFEIEFINGRMLTANRKLDVLAFNGAEWNELGGGYNAEISIDAESEQQLRRKYRIDLCDDEDEVLSDIKRMEYVANWGGQYTFVPNIIEDEQFVYKHTNYNRVMLKAEVGYYYLDDVDWRAYKRRCK